MDASLASENGEKWVYSLFVFLSALGIIFDYFYKKKMAEY